jgi:hypothetical protein
MAVPYAEIKTERLILITIILVVVRLSVRAFQEGLVANALEKLYATCAMLGLAHLTMIQAR